MSTVDLPTSTKSHKPPNVPTMCAVLRIAPLHRLCSTRVEPINGSWSLALPTLTTLCFPEPPSNAQRLPQKALDELHHVTQWPINCSGIPQNTDFQSFRPGLERVARTSKTHAAGTNQIWMLLV